MNLFQALFSFQGRLNRKGFWQALGLHFALLFIVANFVYQQTFSAWLLLPLLVSGYSFLAVAAKRLHDRNRSAKALSILLVPIICYLTSLKAEGTMAWILGVSLPLFIGTMLLLEWGCFAGHPEPNQYGEKGQSLRFK
ncbi:hypothetical protein A4G20_02905 [Pasteurellaceae bacterium RH1A]|nr:hypothetical protein A4G20_02905 [Pasteurellaceae bacterium RH1A]